MAVAFQAVGSLAVSTVGTAMNVTAPTCQAGDILFCQLYWNTATEASITAPDGTWNEVAQGWTDSTSSAQEHQYALFWKVATGSGGTFSFTKGADNSLLFAAVISAWRGADNTTPIDATGVSVFEKDLGSSTVSFNAYDPTSTGVEAVFFAYLTNDTAGFNAAMSDDTNPDCTTRYDLETTTGADCTLACTSGSNDGSAIAARTWTHNSGASNGSTGIVLALVESSGATYTLTADAGSYTLTGQAMSPVVSRVIVMAQGTYMLTGQATTLLKQYVLTTITGVYTLAGGILAFLSTGWRYATKAIASFGDDTKHTSSFTSETKHTANYGSDTKHIVTYGSPTKNTSSDNYIVKS